MQGVIWAAVAGVTLSVMVEGLVQPRPLLRRHFSTWCLHLGLWFVAYAVMVLILGRPWFAMAAVSAFLVLLVQVNNAKIKSLREPFVFHDFEYFTDAIKHPRLYIPFLGWGKFLVALTGFVVAVAIGLMWEASPLDRFSWGGQVGVLLAIFSLGSLLILVGHHFLPRLNFQPESEVVQYGFLASLWGYGAASASIPVDLEQPFAELLVPTRLSELPHLVVVQSESFFDPRQMFSGIRTEVLDAFDQLKSQSTLHGKLVVPAWGANTVRTEFAFLSGLEASELGVHRFNPYRALAAGWNVASIASFLKQLGYRTVCIHPYPASFYLRDRVYPKLGFDTFLDINAFEHAERAGPFIGDQAVAQKIDTLIADATQPTFIYTITMENHGPLHLEKVAPGEVTDLYTTPPPSGCEDLTIYLRHLKNADAMIRRLMNSLDQCERGAALCWFGDHVPIMPSVYERFGIPQGEVDYAIWRNRSRAAVAPSDQRVSNLSLSLLLEMGLILPESFEILEARNPVKVAKP